MKSQRRKPKRIYSPIKQRFLLLLAAGAALHFAGTVGKQLKILSELQDEWKKVDRNYLKQIVREFYVDRLISMTEHPDGTMTAVLTEKGKQRVLLFDIDRMKIAPQEKWDGLWRAAMFDIPEKMKRARRALREKLLDLGFVHWQKSVYVHPYPCRDEIDFVAEFFGVRPCVRYAILTDVTNESELLLHFGLKHTS